MNKIPIVTNNYEIRTNSGMVTGTDTNAYTFTNTGTTQVFVQGILVLPNQSHEYKSNNDEALDFSTYEVRFVFPNNPNNSLLVCRRKVTWKNLER